MRESQFGQTEFGCAARKIETLQYNLPREERHCRGKHSQLATFLDYIRESDIRVITRLDRPAR